MPVIQIYLAWNSLAVIQEYTQVSTTETALFT